jgi:hypothetical protein
MSDLRVIEGQGQTTIDPTSNGHQHDAFQQLAKARRTPKATTDDTGQTLRKLTVANKMAGLAKGTRINGAVQRGEGNTAVIDLAFENDARISATVKQLYDPRHMDGALTLATKVPPDWFTPKEWRPFAIAVIEAAQPDNATDNEATETTEWLASFLDNTWSRQQAADTSTAINLDDGTELYDVLKQDDGAFRGNDSRLYLRPPRLLEHVTLVLHQRATSTELRQRLGRLGFTKPRNSQGQLAARKGDQTITRRYLASQPGFEVS